MRISSNVSTREPFVFGYVDPDTGERVGGNEKQYLAHTTLADWLFYGGAAGGGKSEYLIVEAIQVCLEHPGCEVALFRRYSTELKRSLTLRFLALVPRHIARYNKTDNCARFYNGSILWFCHCNHEHDVYQYQSANWLMLGIDEASHMTEFQFSYLQTRVRSVVKEWRNRVRLASNPGNVGHGWLKRKFVKPGPEELGNRPLPGYCEIWRPIKPADWPVDNPMPTRQFIPAYFKDNTALQRARPDYLAQLYLLGGDKGRQLADGDWDSNESMIVGAEWQASKTITELDVDLVAQGLEPGQHIAWHVVDNPSWRPPTGATIFGSVDYGYGAPWAFHLHAVLPGGHIRTFFEHYMTRVRDVEQAQMIRQSIERLNVGRPEWIVLDPAMKNSREEVGLSKSILDVYDDELGRPLNVHLRLGAGGRGARLSRPNRWKDALAVAPDGLPWWSCTTACPHLIRTVPEVPFDEKDPEVDDDNSENHAYEDTGRFFEARPFPPRTARANDLPVDDILRAHRDAIARREGSQKPRVATLNVTGFTPDDTTH